MKIAVWFSCDAASAVSAKMTLERYPDAEVHIVNNPVAEGDADNDRLRMLAEAKGLNVAEFLRQLARAKAKDV